MRTSASSSIAADRSEGEPRFQGFPGGGFPGGDPAARPSPGGGFESLTFRTGGAGGGGGGGFEDILNSMFSGAGRGGARPGAGGTFEFDPGNCAGSSIWNIAAIAPVSLEEAVNGIEERDFQAADRQGTQCRENSGRCQRRPARNPVEGAGRGRPHRPPPGDLLITVNIAPHAFFKVDGGDLQLRFLPITLYEAVLGGKVRLRAPGRRWRIVDPEEYLNGRTLRLQGQGTAENGRENGDLFVTPVSCCRTKPQRPRDVDAEMASADAFTIGAAISADRITHQNSLLGEHFFNKPKNRGH